MTERRNGGLLGMINRLWQKMSRPKPRQQRRAKERISDHEVEEARRVNLAHLIESLGYKPRWFSAEKAMFSSPLREEKTPSFTVSYFKGRWGWKDWGTGDSGDTISFVQAYYGLSFIEAVRKLNGGTYSSIPSSAPPPSARSEYDEDKIKFVRKLHSDRTSLMSEKERLIIRLYFEDKGVAFYPEMAVVTYHSFRDKKSFVAIPMPHARCIKGLECREIGGTDRKTLGNKTLWFLSRKSSKVLVTESILDALAGEIVLSDNSLSLLSINGVGNVGKLDGVLAKLRPKEVLLALDNDHPGREAQKTAVRIASRYADRVIEIDHHVRAGAKDLHKLLPPARQATPVARAE
ncbi:MAG TPA: CHC2 zinc finger domain-containing protein [Syntrophales bacterium]|nr:CHC2 zinc finger domain-containing protein [Syntrophales bacterium]HQK78983.1 CHC2 zinc finger domain-containing protein [Syntrophales bacterium]